MLKKEHLVRTNSENSDFKYLTSLLDEYLVDIDGDEKDFFANFNQIYYENAIVFYQNEMPVGCGAFKKLENNSAELKRMYVLPESRGKGIANQILLELERWILQQNHTTCLLETSPRLEGAIAMYKKNGFKIIPNYGQYINIESSICMQKILKKVFHDELGTIIIS